MLANRRSEFLKPHLQLVEQPLTALGARIEVPALHLCDRELELLGHRLCNEAITMCDDPRRKSAA